MPGAKSHTPNRHPIDFYKLDRLVVWKWLLSLAAVGVALGWASGLLGNYRDGSSIRERSRHLASRGTLTKAHATWESQCEVCHVPYQPIARGTWVASFGGDSGTNPSDRLCQRCHSGPPHHTCLGSSELACADCHREHRGRDASLERMADSACTQCHASPNAPKETCKNWQMATQFDGDSNYHPDFRHAAQGSDPGRIKFTHARHLARGMASSAKGEPLPTSQILPLDADRARYREWTQGDGVLQLDCNACHRLEAREFQSANPTGPVHGVGRSMVPITYANQCRACHPLDYDPSFPPVPHGLQPAEVHELLGRVYAAQHIEQNKIELKPRILPLPPTGRSNEPELVEARKAVEGKVQKAEELLFGSSRCGKCHQYETPAGEPIEALGAWDPKKIVRTKKSNIPEVWFPSVQFDHSAHRAVDCRECHKGAYLKTPKERENEDVLLPDQKTCATCHHPPGAGGSAAASSDCTECHRYHNADDALSGRGASARAARARFTIEQFLKGELPAKRP